MISFSEYLGEAKKDKRGGSFPWGAATGAAAGAALAGTAAQYAKTKYGVSINPSAAPLVFGAAGAAIGGTIQRLGHGVFRGKQQLPGKGDSAPKELPPKWNDKTKSKYLPPDPKPMPQGRRTPAEALWGKRRGLFREEKNLLTAFRLAVRRQAKDWKTLKDNPHLTTRQKIEYMLHKGNEHAHDLANYHHDVTTPTQGALQIGAGITGGVLKDTAAIYGKLKARAEKKKIEESLFRFRKLPGHYSGLGRRRGKMNWDKARMQNKMARQGTESGNIDFDHDTMLKDLYVNKGMRSYSEIEKHLRDAGHETTRNKIRGRLRTIRIHAGIEPTRIVGNQGTEIRKHIASIFDKTQTIKNIKQSIKDNLGYDLSDNAVESHIRKYRRQAGEKGLSRKGKHFEAAEVVKHIEDGKSHEEISKLTGRTKRNIQAIINRIKRKPVNETVIRTYHGTQSELKTDEGDLPRNRLQRRFFSTTKKDEAKKYGPNIYTHDIDTSDYLHYKGKQRSITDAIRKGYKGMVRYDAPDMDGNKDNPHTEIVTFDYNTIKRINESRDKKHKPLPPRIGIPIT